MAADHNAHKTCYHLGNVNLHAFSLGVVVFPVPREACKRAESTHAAEVLWVLGPLESDGGDVTEREKGNGSGFDPHIYNSITHTGLEGQRNRDHWI